MSSRSCALDAKLLVRYPLPRSPLHAVCFPKSPLPRRLRRLHGNGRPCRRLPTKMGVLASILIAPRVLLVAIGHTVSPDSNSVRNAIERASAGSCKCCGGPCTCAHHYERSACKSRGGPRRPIATSRESARTATGGANTKLFCVEEGAPASIQNHACGGRAMRECTVCCHTGS